MKTFVPFETPALVLAVVVAATGLAPRATAQNPTPAPAVVTVRATDPYASEICGAIAIVDSGKFTFFRTGGTNYALLVHYTVSGSASNGVDYTKLSGVVEIPTNSYSADVYVAPFCDSLTEGTESVTVRIEPIVCVAIWPPPPDCYVVGQPAEATVYIRDWGWPPYVSILQPTNGQAFRWPAKVDIAAHAVDPNGYITSLHLYDGTNVIGGESRVYFLAPTNGTPFDFKMTWTNVPSGRHTLIAKATDSQGTVGASEPVTILVGDPPPVTNPPPVVTLVATDPIAIEGTNCWGWPNATNRFPSGTTNLYAPRPNTSTWCWWFTNCGPKAAIFAVRRAGDASHELRVKYDLGGTALNGVDYDLLPGYVLLPAGQRKAEIVIVPVAEPRPDPIKTVVIRLTPVLPGSNLVPPPYIVGTPSRAGALIVDSDRPWPGPSTSTTADRCFVLANEAEDGAWYRVECSTNLRTWLPLCTNQAVQGAVYFVDPEAQDNLSRFYRTVPEPNPPQE